MVRILNGELQAAALAVYLLLFSEESSGELYSAASTRDPPKVAQGAPKGAKGAPEGAKRAPKGAKARGAIFYWAVKSVYWAVKGADGRRRAATSKRAD